MLILCRARRRARLRELGICRHERRHDRSIERQRTSASGAAEGRRQDRASNRLGARTSLVLCTLARISWGLHDRPTTARHHFCMISSHRCGSRFNCARASIDRRHVWRQYTIFSMHYWLLLIDPPVLAPACSEL
jgi:hypothetical protein